MCSENKRKTKSTAFWKRAVTTCGKPHPLLSETAVTTYGNPFTAYKLCLDSTRKIASTDFWKRAVITCGKSHTLLSSLQWQHEKPSAVFKYAVKTHGKSSQLLFERGQWQHVENHIHCLVKQQWQYKEIHPLSIKCDMTTHGKQHLLFFKREHWQLVKSHIHCLVKQ